MMKVLAKASLMDRLKIAWSLVVNKGAGDVPMPIAFNDLVKFMTGSGLKEPYTSHAWVYACVRTIAQNLSQVPWLIVSGTEDRPRPVPETNPLVALYESPNSLMSRY